MNNIISIGGIGGSGTRVVAESLRELGFFIGDDLNRPLDNLLFTLLFKRQNILTLDKKSFYNVWMLYKKLMSGNLKLTEDEKILLATLEEDRTLHNKSWLKERITKIGQYTEKTSSKWGWKEPNTHIVIDKLLELEPQLKFVYVYRNGLDMAHSSNQNQLKLWGSIFLNSYEIDISPRNSLKYWVIIHKRMLFLQSQYPKRILFLKFESFCKDTKEKLQELASFFEVGISNQNIQKLEKIIALPDTVDRYKSFSFDNYDKSDIEYIKSIYCNI